jgi:hypothetical protein
VEICFSYHVLVFKINVDVVERFHLSIFLFIVTIRNCLEILGIGAITDFTNYFQDLGRFIFSMEFFGMAKEYLIEHPWTPYSIWGSFWGNLNVFFNSNEFSLLQIILGPSLIIWMTEFVVDWIKHSFIVKFNGILPDVYNRYRESLLRDILGFRLSEGILVEKRFVPGNRSPIVARRIGFLAFPISCLCIRVMLQVMENAGFIPETLAAESLEDVSPMEGELGSWKLPFKLHVWMSKVRRLQSDNSTLWLKDTFANVWGFLLIFIM